MRRPWLLSCVIPLLFAASCGRKPATPPADGKPQAAATDQKPAVKESVDPESVAALKEMSAYLGTLQSFDLVSSGSLDAVTQTDQRVQIDGVAHYKAKRPAGIWLDFESDLKHRRFFYDGKNFTIYSPKLGFYASTSAPPTNRELLKKLYDDYGIKLPLEDLFRWNDADESDIKALTSGFYVGEAKIDGTPTDHWAFRQGDFDWEVWIDQGERPLPRKLVIIDRSDVTRPTYTTRLKWTVNPTFAADTFTFKPDKDAKRIQLAQFRGDSK